MTGHGSRLKIFIKMLLLVQFVPFFSLLLDQACSEGVCPTFPLTEGLPGLGDFEPLFSMGQPGLGGMRRCLCEWGRTRSLLPGAKQMSAPQEAQWGSKWVHE